jgi:SOS-response transcriptional repressor LexA
MTAHRRYDDTAVLSWIETYIADRHHAPTVRQIQAACGISSTSVTRDILGRLVDAGAICYTPFSARSITLGSSAPLVVSLRGVEQAIERGRPSEALRALRALLRRLEGQSG